MHSASLFSRMPANRFAPGCTPAFVALAGVICLVLAACSPGADYPSLFPAVHDIPPPRTDTPLDANQVQQVTEDLITARDRLNTEAQTSQSKPAPKSSTNKSSTNKSSTNKSSTNKSSANKSSADKSSAKAAPGSAKKPMTQVSGHELPGSEAAQTAGAETK